MIYRHEYKVKGNFAFPIDMLKYEQSFPARGEDASVLAQSMLRSWSGGEVVLVTLSPDKKWTPADQRWESFGWVVVEGSLNTMHYGG